MSRYIKLFSVICGCLAEWLRRQIRNLLAHCRVGSNPAAVENPLRFASAVTNAVCMDQTRLANFSVS